MRAPHREHRGKFPADCFVEEGSADVLRFARVRLVRVLTFGFIVGSFSSTGHQATFDAMKDLQILCHLLRRPEIDKKSNESMRTGMNVTISA